MAARSLMFVERVVEYSVFGWIGQLRRVAQQHATETHLDPVEHLIQCEWMGKIDLVKANLPVIYGISLSGSIVIR